jgi:hypothetical protein
MLKPILIGSWALIGVAQNSATLAAMTDSKRATERETHVAVMVSSWVSLLIP